jgi:hypothetical protein
MFKFSNVIYKISFIGTEKVYIGQTNCFGFRKQQHLEAAFDETLPSFHYKIYKAIREYGKENAVFSIIHSNVKIKQMNFMEVKEIERHDSIKNGFNMVPGGGFPGRGPDEPIQNVIYENSSKKKSKKNKKNSVKPKKDKIPPHIPKTVEEIVMQCDDVVDIKSHRQCEKCLETKEMRFFNKIKGGSYNKICIICNEILTRGTKNGKKVLSKSGYDRSSVIIKVSSWENLS